MPLALRRASGPLRLSLFALPLTLAACQPPAADDYVERVEPRDARGAASEPLPDPDVEGAIWAATDGGERIIYGQQGRAPMLALECVDEAPAPQIALTRFAKADPQAKAMMALIGNSHIARLPVDAEWNGRAWLWQGSYAADHPDLAVFTGRRDVELTIPGAGSLVLNPSSLPARLIRECSGVPGPAIQLDPGNLSEQE